MTTKKRRLVTILLACLLSGIAAGVLTATQCRRVESDCRLAPLQPMSSEPASWGMWLDWPNWLPGMLFGLAFCMAVLQHRTAGRTRRILLYTLASAAAYVAAGAVFSVFLRLAGQDQFSLIVWIWPAGFSAGLVGGLLLAVSARGILRVSASRGPGLSGVWLGAVVGAVAGVVFVFVCIYGEQKIFLAWPVGFSIWQIAVGLSLGHRST